MRVPYIINRNTHIEYEPSEVTKGLLDEINRKLVSENLERTDDLPLSLVQLCVKCIAKNFEQFPIINDLVLCADKDLLLETMSTDLPLALVVPLIEEEIYWKRCFTNKYGVNAKRSHASWTWKCIYLENYMQELVEQAQPEYNDEENMEDITNLLNPFVHRLIISQLQCWKPPLNMDKEEIPEILPVDHINMEPIFRRLGNIEELDLKYGQKHVGEKFSWNMFRMSLDDARRLGNAILNLKKLRILSLINSPIGDAHVSIIIKELIKIPSLEELKLISCLFGDRGALCIAKLMMCHQSLQKIVLINNKIGGVGGEGIGYALMQEDCCPIKHINLRLNPLGHKGIMGLFRALVRVQKLEELIISGCSFEEETSQRLGAVLQLHKNLKLIDVSNNWLYPGSQKIWEGMKQNTTLHMLDLRETDIEEEIYAKITKRCAKNRRGDTEDSDEEVELVDENKEAVDDEEEGEEMEENVEEESIEEEELNFE